MNSRYGSAEINMDLFSPIVDASKLHPNFRNLLCLGDGFAPDVFAMDVLNDWSHGFVDRDGKFVHEFQTSFNSCFWELYLFAVLKAYGMQVDFSHDRPDFCILGLNLIIEATVASNSQGNDPEHARLNKTPAPDLNEFNLRTIVRLSNSLAVKHQKYLDSYAALNHVKDRPFVVAVTNLDQPFSFLACQRPIEAVLYGYYVDEERYLSTGGKGSRLKGEELRKVFKDNGSPIQLGLFTTSAYKEVSAVIFSNCANMGKVRALSSDPNPGIIFNALRFNPASGQPHLIKKTKPNYEENLLDGIRIYHNPYATHPLDPALFRHRSVFQWSFQEGKELIEQCDGQLLFRCVWRAIQSK
jgi:hypothetical protein